MRLALGEGGGLVFHASSAPSRSLFVKRALTPARSESGDARAGRRALAVESIPLEPRVFLYGVRDLGDLAVRPADF